MLNTLLVFQLPYLSWMTIAFQLYDVFVLAPISKGIHKHEETINNAGGNSKCPENPLNKGPAGFITHITYTVRGNGLAKCLGCFSRMRLIFLHHYFMGQFLPGF